MSGGHLCEAEAPTEPAGETQSGCGNPFLFLRGITDSFALCAQNDKPFSCCKYIRCTENRRPVIARGFSPVAIRFSFKGNTDSFTLRVQNDKPFSCCKYIRCTENRRPVIARVRVSGGHLCEAEAPTEPAGETQSGCGNPFLFLRGIRILSRCAFRMTNRLVAKLFCQLLYCGAAFFV